MWLSSSNGLGPLGEANLDIEPILCPLWPWIATGQRDSDAEDAGHLHLAESRYVAWDGPP